MLHKIHDITPLPVLTGEHGSGPVRHHHPIYRDLLPPCAGACLAGEDVQAWLVLARDGRYLEAWQILMRANPLPAVEGRVCYHPCEAACNREELDEAVSIHAVERFLGDLALAEGWQIPVEAPSSGKRVMVVGAGPSGLSAAYHLTLLGHQVVILEAGPVAGGMLHFGIPAYRLPREILRQEVGRIEAMGVRISLNHKVDDLLAEQTAGRFDAVFLAIGAHAGKHIDIPARDAVRVLDAVSMLHGVSLGERPKLGRRVVIYGGGNTAMDAARTAKRLGASEAIIVYRRDRAHMAAHDFEATEALSEDVKIRWLTTIKEIDGASLTVEEMEIGPDGFPHPTGRLDTLEADSVVLALGQEAESGFLRTIEGIQFKADGTVMVGPDMMTGYAGIFAGGDMAPGERTVTAAVGHGRRAARYIDAWLQGTACVTQQPPRQVRFTDLHLPVMTDAEQVRQKSLASGERARGFKEVVHGLSEHDAQREAERCLSCGVCFECDNCYASCPEQAIIKLGPGKRYRFDYARCTGCATCYEQCPCHAIEMEPEAAS